jgi:ribonuclease HI
MPTRLQIFTDGGARGNPGPAASAFVVFGPDNKLLFQAGRSLGITTNNQAEYSGVLQAVKWLTQNSPTSEVTFFLDSLLVVNQLKGLYKIKDRNLKKIHSEIQTLIVNSNLLIVNYCHVPRSQNSTADLLVNQTLDNLS